MRSSSTGSPCAIQTLEQSPSQTASRAAMRVGVQLMPLLVATISASRINVIIIIIHSCVYAFAVQVRASYAVANALSTFIYPRSMHEAIEESERY